MAIKLEVGKRYELNNGEVHECTDMYGDDPLAVDGYEYGPFVVNDMCYHQDVRWANYDAEDDLSVKRCVDDAPKLWRDMTPEEKGALLLAHHEGKAIEWNATSEKTGKWAEWSDCDDDFLWDGKFLGNGFAYRVKPEPVRETVALYGAPGKHIEWRVEQCGLDTHRITFNVIDGVPDCASVKMEEL